MTPRKRTVYAAGGVLWRPRDPALWSTTASDDEWSAAASGETDRFGKNGTTDVEVAMIHRPRYDDWTLPKGKQEDGENLVRTAVREIAEETGASVRLGRRLARVDYTATSSTRKHVHYWSARWRSGEFVVNDEVDELRWLPMPEARATASYKADRKVIDEFARLPAQLRTVLVARHAKAGRSSRYRGDDRLRPLEPVGLFQAERLAEQFVAFGADRIHAADRTRCLQTVEPFALRTGQPVVVEPALSEESYRADPGRALRRMTEIVDEPGTPVVCSQGKVIPGLLAAWTSGHDVTIPRTRNRKASMWVVALRGDHIVCVDHVDSPLQ